MRKRKSLLQTDDQEEIFWPAFTDLTSTIALILFVLVLLAYLQNLISGKNLENTKATLQDTLARLSSSNAEISRSEKRLALLENDLKSTMAEIEAGRIELRLSEEKVQEQQSIIAESNRELGNLRSRLQGIAVLRLNVLERVKKAIETELKPSGSVTDSSVYIADNGNIVINESLVFEYNSYQIKSEGKRLLKTLAFAFGKLLADDNIRDNIDVILVQGHTDERGSVAYNRELSAKRSNTVLNYMFESEKSLETSFGRYFASSAYAEYRPVNPAKNEQAFEQNRRIELSVVVKDSSVQSVIDEYLESQTPDLAQN